MLYNYGAAILRAIGDTKRPLPFSDHLRTDQRSIEYAARYLLSHGSGRRGDRYGDLTADLLHPGIMVPV